MRTRSAKLSASMENSDSSETDLEGLDSSETDLEGSESRQQQHTAQLARADRGLLRCRTSSTPLIVQLHEAPAHAHT